MKIYYLLIGLFLLGCENPNKDNVEFPINTSFNEKVMNNNIVYQFYEKFGFTDICIHHRIVVKVEEFNPTSEWYFLPIPDSIVKRINNISNKVDKVGSKTYSTFYKDKEAFTDITIESKEYIKESVSAKDIELSLENGFYKYENNTIKIYDPIKKLLYIEVHTCDGL